MNITPPCPADHYEFECNFGDVNMVCHFEHFPFERGSVDLYGALYEPDLAESIILQNVYVKGSDVDIIAIVKEVFLDEIERNAYKDFEAYK